MRNRGVELMQEIIRKIDKEDADILAWIAVGIIGKYLLNSLNHESKSKKDFKKMSNEELYEELSAL